MLVTSCILVFEVQKVSKVTTGYGWGICQNFSKSSSPLQYKWFINEIKCSLISIQCGNSLTYIAEAKATSKSQSPYSLSIVVFNLDHNGSIIQP